VTLRAHQLRKGGNGWDFQNSNGPAQRHRLRRLFLVSTAVFITNIDRSTLATATSLMQDERHLSTSRLGRYRCTW
jgi:hypothetical protein